MAKKSQYQSGYSLPELIMIIIIIGILAGIAFSTVGNLVTNSRIKASEREMVEIVSSIIGNPETGLLGFVNEVGRMPVAKGSSGSQADFYQLYNIDGASPYNPFTRTGWNGPYIDLKKKDVNRDNSIGAEEYDALFDAWGNAYQYDDANHTITSTGPNGALDASDDMVVDIK